MPVPELSVPLSLLRRRLLAWFVCRQRDLPWRRDRDAYRIWISEVMLQQTMVATVASRFEPFLAAFPTLDDLAAANEQDVLRHWEGLGYYRRARNLHAAARILVENHSSQLPNDEAVWADLPGVGRYILGAVLSQAFDRRLPVVEANSRRVLCRLFGRAGDPTREPVQSWLWLAAEDLLPKTRCGDFNQAMMELGALVCLPSAPRCHECPLAAGCIARQRELQDVVPELPSQRPISAMNEVGLVVRKGPRVLLAQRPASGRWANMWEFPHGPRLAAEAPTDAAPRILRELTGLTASVGLEILTVRHTVMRSRITMVCLEMACPRGRFRSAAYVQGRWIAPADLSRYPVSSPQRILAEEVRQGRRRLF